MFKVHFMDSLRFLYQFRKIEGKHLLCYMTFVMSRYH